VPPQLVNLHRTRRYFVIKLHTWFCLSYFLKTNIQFYCIYQYFMSINSDLKHTDFAFSIQSCRFCYAYTTSLSTLILQDFCKQNVLKMVLFIVNINKDENKSLIIGHPIRTLIILVQDKKYIAKITCRCFPTSTRKFT
jgi:hypothetical protein